jgi:hypothetical protein
MNMLINTKYGLLDLAVRPLLGMTVMVVTRGGSICNSPLPSYMVKEGSLLMRRGKAYSIYETIEDALSALMQAVETYGDDRRGEFAAVNRWRVELKQLVADLLDFDRIYAKGVAESAIMGVGSELSGSSAAPKKAAKKMVTAAASSNDALGRRNPGRQRMLLAQAERKLEKRIVDAKRIKGKMVERLVVLGRRYQNCVLAVRSVREGISALPQSEEWKRIIEAGPSAGEASGMLTTESRLQAIANCKLMIDLVSSLDIAPFIVYRYLTLGDLNSAIGALEADRLTMAKAFLDHAFSGSRIALAHVRLERIRYELCALAKRGEPVDGEKYAERLTCFLANLREIDEHGLTASNLEAVTASVGGAINKVRNGDHVTTDHYLDRAIRLL